MKILGVDPSIKSTGLYMDDDGVGGRYGLITHSPTKTIQKLPIELYIYKHSSATKLSGREKEVAKTENVACIIDLFSTILDLWSPDMVYIEAIAFSASGTIDQLAGINYAMRLECVRRGIPVHAINPTTLKHVVTGNGRATKEELTDLWRKCTDIEWKGKVDDLVDAFWLSQFGRKEVFNATQIS